ncbi:uncharacterized protein LOC142346309 isoform X2 [Convolutriloba macropyga]
MTHHPITLPRVNKTSLIAEGFQFIHEINPYVLIVPWLILTLVAVLIVVCGQRTPKKRSEEQKQPIDISTA